MPTTFLKNPVDMNATSTSVSLSVTGTPAAATTGGGAQPAPTLMVEGTAGQETTGTGQTAGAGADVLITAGVGGAAPSGSAKGAGGSVTINPGTPGAGGGAGGAYGNLLLATAGGNVGIGTTSPAGTVHLAKDGDTIHYISAAGTGVNAAIVPRRSRGTHSSPTNVGDGDVLFQFAAQPYAGSFFDTADFRMEVEGAVTSSQRPGSRFRFFTNQQNGSVMERLRITAGGNVGIGTPSPAGLLHIAKDGDTIQFISAAGVGVNAALVPRRSRGTHGSPTNVADGDLLFQFVAQPYAGSFFDTADFRMEVDGAVTSSQRPGSRFRFFTNEPNGSVTERLRITSTGNVGLGIAAPGSKLHVNGGVQVGAPTGGDMGTGSINVSGDVYKNGTPMLAKLEKAYSQIIDLAKRIDRLEATLARTSTKSSKPTKSIKSVKSVKARKERR